MESHIHRWDKRKFYYLELILWPISMCKYQHSVCLVTCFILYKTILRMNLKWSKTTYVAIIILINWFIFNVYLNAFLCQLSCSSIMLSSPLCHNLCPFGKICESQSFTFTPNFCMRRYFELWYEYLCYITKLLDK